MTLSTLTSVASISSSAIPTSDPNINDRTVISQYVADLKNRGFCKLDNAASNQTRLINRFSQNTLPLSFIENDFSQWLRFENLECSYRSVYYIIRTLRHVIGSKFMPENIEFYVEPQTGCTFVNTYRSYRPTIDCAEVSPMFLEYLERLAPDEHERHIFVQWIAHLFQHPEQRPSWHIMMPSEPGCGKGFLVHEILHPLLHHTSCVAEFSKVMGRFSNILEDSLVVLLDDCKARSESTQTQLKSLLSEERTYCERKMLQGGMVNTYTRFILASNEHKPLTLDASERRWFVLARLVHRQDKEETQRFIQSLADWLSLPGSLCKVYNYFKTYSLEGFNHKCVPDSDGLSAIVGMSQNPYSKFLESFVRDHEVFRYPDLIDAIKKEGLSKPSDRQLPHLLREVGFENGQPRIGGKQTRLYYRSGMSLDEIREAYKVASPTY